jgi:hypothetical protein
VTVAGPGDAARRDWEPRSGYARTWAGSKLVDWLYVAIAVGGAASFALVVTDCVASWFHDRVLIGPGALTKLSFWTMMPGWVLLMASAFLLRDVFFRRGVKGRRPRLRLTRYTVSLALCAAAVAAFAIGDSAHGDKGSARVLAGPVYQVSYEVDNDGDWRTVTRPEYQSFDARLVRGESGIAVFGPIEVGVCLFLLRWRRKGFPLPPGSESGTAI